MGVAVYPRLGRLLRTRNLSVAELGREIESRLGLSTDPKTLYRLASDAPIQRADLEVAGAIASILGISLDELFDVKIEPRVSNDDTEQSVLDADQARRLSELFDRQSTGHLLPSEQDELNALVSAYGRKLHEQRLREFAHNRGVSLEEARAQSAKLLDEAQRWWQTIEEDPMKRRELVRSRRHVRNSSA
jgi:transcriptional regulator with XRE-family HTH domain